MSEDVDLVRRYFEARFVSRVGVLPELVHDDVELHAPNGEIVRGIDAVADLWGQQPSFEHLAVEPQLAGVEALGEGRVLALIDHVFRWKETGEISNVDHRATVFEIDGGKVRRAQMYASPDEVPR